jgi:hypothetical protein
VRARVQYCPLVTQLSFPEFVSKHRWNSTLQAGTEVCAPGCSWCSWCRSSELSVHRTVDESHLASLSGTICPRGGWWKPLGAYRQNYLSTALLMEVTCRPYPELSVHRAVDGRHLMSLATINFCNRYKNPSSKTKNDFLLCSCTWVTTYRKMLMASLGAEEYSSFFRKWYTTGWLDLDTHCLDITPHMTHMEEQPLFLTTFSLLPCRPSLLIALQWYEKKKN